MVLSQNGWLANDRTLIATAQIPGAGFGLAVRKGAATTVLIYVAARFHAEVEPLLPGQCWGYAERLIRGSATTVSNHASGTAIDCNSLKHPLAAVGTFTPAQRAAIRRILTDCRGLVRWGGNYSGRKDEMHFELVGTQAQINDLASRLTTLGSRIPDLTPAPTPALEDDMPTPIIAVHPSNGRWFVTDLASYATYIDNAAVAAEMGSFLGLARMEPSTNKPYPLGPGYAPLLDRLAALNPNNPKGA